MIVCLALMLPFAFSQMIQSFDLFQSTITLEANVSLKKE